MTPPTRQAMLPGANENVQQKEMQLDFFQPLEDWENVVQGKKL